MKFFLEVGSLKKKINKKKYIYISPAPHLTKFPFKTPRVVEHAATAKVGSGSQSMAETIQILLALAYVFTIS